MCHQNMWGKKTKKEYDSLVVYCWTHSYRRFKLQLSISPCHRVHICGRYLVAGFFRCSFFFLSLFLFIFNVSPLHELYEIINATEIISELHFHLVFGACKINTECISIIKSMCAHETWKNVLHRKSQHCHIKHCKRNAIPSRHLPLRKQKTLLNWLGGKGKNKRTANNFRYFSFG